MLQDIRDKLLGKFAIGLIGLIAVSFVFDSKRTRMTGDVLSRRGSRVRVPSTPPKKYKGDPSGPLYIFPSKWTGIEQAQLFDKSAG